MAALQLSLVLLCSRYCSNAFKREAICALIQICSESKEDAMPLPVRVEMREARVGRHSLVAVL